MFSQVPQIYGEDPVSEFEAFSFTAGSEVRTGKRFVSFSFTAADETRAGVIEEEQKTQREKEAPGRKGKFRRERKR